MILNASFTYGLAFYRVLQDFETQEYNYAPRPNAPTPETVKSLDDRFIGQGEAWQCFAFEQLRLSAGDSMTLDELKKAWAGLMDGGRAWSNDHGSDTCADYINGTNLDKSPIALETITAGGAVHLCIGESIHAAGADWLPFAALDCEKPIPNVNYQTHPWLFKLSTIIRDDGHVIPFPQLKGLDVPVLFVAKGGVCYLRTDRVERLPAGAPFPRPYVPAR